ncbi:hypothetical protein INR49_030182 [Caranx melampygus]|nr:hypothetical protein INR49_030182 [Caranx melampygus]
MWALGHNAPLCPLTYGFLALVPSWKVVIAKSLPSLRVPAWHTLWLTTRTPPASKQKDEKLTCCCSLTDGRTVPHLPDAGPSFFSSLQVPRCRRLTSTPKTIIRLPEGGHSTESANKR